MCLRDEKIVRLSMPIRGRGNTYAKPANFGSFCISFGYPFAVQSGSHRGTELVCTILVS